MRGGQGDRLVGVKREGRRGGKRRFVCFLKQDFKPVCDKTKIVFGWWMVGGWAFAIFFWQSCGGEEGDGADVCWDLEDIETWQRCRRLAVRMMEERRCVDPMMGVENEACKGAECFPSFLHMFTLRRAPLVLSANRRLRDAFWVLVSNAGMLQSSTTKKEEKKCLAEWNVGLETERERVEKDRNAEIKHLEIAAP